MTWVLVAFISPLLFVTTNYIDKHLIEKYLKGRGVGALIIFSALIGVILVPFISLFYPEVIRADFGNISIITLNGIIWTFAIVPYLYAMKEDDVSVVTPLFSAIPVLTLVFGYILLGETVSLLQSAGISLVVIGEITLSFELSGKKIGFKARVFWLMMLSAFFVAVNSTIFKYAAIQEDFWTTAFWESAGLAVSSVFFLLVPSYRKQFLSIISKNTTYILSLNIINEIIGIAAKLVANFATLFIPLAVVYAINETQPVFTLVFGVFLSIFFPHIVREHITKKGAFHRAISIAIIVFGVFLLK